MEFRNKDKFLAKVIQLIFGLNRYVPLKYCFYEYWQDLCIWILCKFVLICCLLDLVKVVIRSVCMYLVDAYALFLLDFYIQTCF